MSDEAAPSAPAPSDMPTVPHKAKAWEFFRSIGAPKFHVAPMVDQSELPFRRLCRKYGATCAYTPMFHARLFCEDVKYRNEIFTTCESDRPLLVQFCANNPDYLVRAANIAAPNADAIDINFGCPQRIAKRGNYGSFLMDDLPLVERLVTSLVQGVSIPVTCKIRVFPKVEDTITYARMIERSGCSVLAVHGRTRDQKDLSATRADWDQIKAVKEALQIPVLANGNIRHLQDALDLMAFTGADGVLSAESLLEDPALYSPCRLMPEGAYKSLDRIKHCLEYLAMCEETPTALRMVRGHIHKFIGPWLAEYTDLRDRLHRGIELGGLPGFIAVAKELDERVRASGRSEPVPAIPPRALRRMAQEEARKAAIAEQEREAAALGALASPAQHSTEALQANGADASVQSTGEAGASQNGHGGALAAAAENANGRQHTGLGSVKHVADAQEHSENQGASKKRKGESGENVTINGSGHADDGTCADCA